MELVERLEFAGPPRAVRSMSLDPVYLRRCAEDMGAVRVALATTKATSTVTILIVPPPQLQATFGPELEVYHQSAWAPDAPDGSTHGAIRISNKRNPIALTGRFETRPGGAGCVVDYLLDLAGVPPVAEPRLVPLLEPLFRQAFRILERNGKAYLARSGVPRT